MQGKKETGIPRAGDRFMQAALEEAYDGIRHGHGGPFGSVIVRDGAIIGRGHNRVLEKSDPTCHGEIEAIRDACANRGSHDLKGCILYTTGEPCPMCLFACLWANIDKIFYGCPLEENSRIGFRDKEMNAMVTGRERMRRSGFLVCIDREACVKLFQDYLSMEHGTY